MIAHTTSGFEHMETCIRFRYPAFTPLADLLRLHMLRDPDAGCCLLDLCKATKVCGNEIAKASPGYESEFVSICARVILYL